MNDVARLFDSRLAVLSQLVEAGASHFGNDDFLELRLIEDMHPLRTQILFTCNQVVNYTQWVQGQQVSNLENDFTSAAQATQFIADVRAALATVDWQNVTIPAGKRMDFGAMYAELSGPEYVQDFLIPNLYFHMVTAYDILRAHGVAVGKTSFMAHLMDRVKPV